MFGNVSKNFLAKLEGRTRGGSGLILAGGREKAQNKLGLSWTRVQALLNKRKSQAQTEARPTYRSNCKTQLWVIYNIRTVKYYNAITSLGICSIF
jgi:hypothetical protein